METAKKLNRVERTYLILGHNLSIGKNNCFSERIRFRERIFLLDRKNRFSYN